MQLVAATTRPDGSPSFAYHHDGAKGGDGDEPRGSRMSQEDSSWSQIVNLYSQVSSRGCAQHGLCSAWACMRQAFILENILCSHTFHTAPGIGRICAQRVARVLYAAFP